MKTPSVLVSAAVRPSRVSWSVVIIYKKKSDNLIFSCGRQGFQMVRPPNIHDYIKLKLFYLKRLHIQLCIQEKYYYFRVTT